MGGNDGCTPRGFFAGSPAGLALFTAVQNAVAAIGQAEIRVTKSQIAFRRRKGFAYVWRPGQYVKSKVPAVLSIALPDKVASNRFKEVAHPAAKVWLHHLELSDPAEIDAEVRTWLAEAYDVAARATAGLQLHVDEAGVVALEGRGDRLGGPVAVLGHVEVGLAGTL